MITSKTLSGKPGVVHLSPIMHYIHPFLPEPTKTAPGTSTTTQPPRNFRPARRLSIHPTLTARLRFHSPTSAQRALSVLHTSRGTVGRCWWMRPVSRAWRMARVTASSGTRLDYSTASDSQFLLLRRTETQIEAPVNSVLAAPVVDHLVRHTKISRQETQPTYQQPTSPEPCDETRADIDTA